MRSLLYVVVSMAESEKTPQKAQYPKRLTNICGINLKSVGMGLMDNRMKTVSRWSLRLSKRNSNVQF